MTAAGRPAPGPVDVCVVGSANFDLVATSTRLPLPGETVLGSGFAEHPGGKGLNQCVAAARSGATTAFVSAVGDDAAGAALLGVMRDEGIDASAVAVRSGVPTGRALIGVADDGENSIIVVAGANETVVVERVPASRVLLAQLEVPVEAVTRAFALAREAGATTVLNPAPARTLPPSLIACSDVVVPNEHEVDVLGGPDALLAMGARAVVVTKGAEGVAVHTPGSVVHLRAYTVDTVDTTGAGDTFCGALCSRLAAGEPLVDALEYALAAAALSTTRHGAVPSIPGSAEVLALVERGRSPGPDTTASALPPEPRTTEPAARHALGPSSPRWTHVALPTSDIDASIDWYERFTPLRLLERREDADGEGAWLGHPDMGATPFVLVLVGFSRDHGAGPLATLAPFAHLGVELPARADVDDVAERGRAAGCLVWEPQQLPDPIGYVCALADPDGNVVEFSFDQGVYDAARRIWGP